MRSLLIALISVASSIATAHAAESINYTELLPSRTSTFDVGSSWMKSGKSSNHGPAGGVALIWDTGFRPLPFWAVSFEASARGYEFKGDNTASSKYLALTTHKNGVLLKGIPVQFQFGAGVINESLRLADNENEAMGIARLRLRLFKHAEYAVTLIGGSGFGEASSALYFDIINSKLQAVSDFRWALRENVDSGQLTIGLRYSYGGGFDTGS